MEARGYGCVYVRAMLTRKVPVQTTISDHASSACDGVLSGLGCGQLSLADLPSHLGVRFVPGRRKELVPVEQAWLRPQAVRHRGLPQGRWQLGSRMSDDRPGRSPGSERRNRQNQHSLWLPARGVFPPYRRLGPIHRGKEAARVCLVCGYPCGSRGRGLSLRKPRDKVHRSGLARRRHCFSSLGRDVVRCLQTAYPGEHRRIPCRREDLESCLSHGSHTGIRPLRLPLPGGGRRLAGVAGVRGRARQTVTEPVLREVSFTWSQGRWSHSSVPPAPASPPPRCSFRGCTT